MWGDARSFWGALLDTLTRYYRLDPKKIILLKALLETHEGFCVLRTFDPVRGIVQLLVSPDFVHDLDELLRSVAESLWLEPVADPTAGAS